jgi:hypothetical protein
LEAPVQETGDKTERRTTGIVDIGELGMDTTVPGPSNEATVEAPGRPKRRKAPRQEGVDALNGCLCGEVLQPSMVHHQMMF